jgi:hypothetical protein
MSNTRQLDAGPSARLRSLAIGAIAGQLLFVVGTLVLGAIEGHGYSAAEHDVSDLSAVGAHHAGLMLAITGVAGAITIAFALGAVGPALRVPGLPGPRGAWLLALSLPAFDTFTDLFFRLDCQAAKAGCDGSVAFSSWHGKMHGVTFFVALVATIATPFALARRMSLIDAWQALARPTKRYGIALIIALAVTAATTGSSVQGLGQRFAIVVACGGMIALAVAVLERAGGSERT